VKLTVGPAPVRHDASMTSSPGERPAIPVALVHDQLVQRGGAERVALLLTQAFPDAPLYTSFYDPDRTFPEFAAVDVRPSPVNHLAPLRGHVRLALPLLAPAFSRIRPEAMVTVCSSTGWAHGVRPPQGRTVVYCHAPARWLYQADRYLGRHQGPATPRPRAARLAAVALGVLGPSLRRWDGAAARRAHRYLANSTATAAAVASTYGIDAEVLPPPPGLDPDGPRRPPPGLAGAEEGFWLCVARLLPYKNVDVVMAAVARRPGDRLVVVGDGPELPTLQAAAGPCVTFTGSVDDEELRWLYGAARGLVAASFEDFGLTPLEAAAFGKPSVVLGAGGFLDTVIDGETGILFDRPEPGALAAALDRLDADGASADALARQTRRFGAERFRARVRQIVADERAAGEGP
jgi:glycosyltransferase involved in cell wall biosynthesis